MRPFAFRQRVGDVNWRAVSSVDVERIVDDNKIEDLQSIIDDVTFCDVKSSDIKGNTISSTKKLVHLMQLMLEYLLYCQESQLQLVSDLRQKNQHMKNQNKVLSQKNESAKEDIRIYRRQIALMKDSIKNLNIKDKTIEHPPRVFDPLRRDREHKDKAAESLTPIIDSMLQHERETRNFVKDIIHEQRSSFLSEFEKISATIQNSGQRANAITAEDVDRKLEHNMDKILSELRKSQYTRRESDSNKENLTALEAERQKLRELERQLGRREANLSLREEKLSVLQKEVQDRTHDLDMRAQQVVLRASGTAGVAAAPRPLPQRSIGVNTEEPPSAEDTAASMPNNAVAFNMLMRLIKRGAKEKCQVAFIQWKNLATRTSHKSHKDQISKLKTDNSNLSAELERLRTKLAAQSERLLVEAARANTAARRLKELEVARILAEQSDAGVNTSSSVVLKRPNAEVVETEEQMMAVARRRVEAQMVEPDVAAIVETLASEIVHKTDEEKEE